MKKYIILFFVSCVYLVSYSQYGSVELSSGGFSPVPAFTDNQPNFVINAGTSSKKRISAHFVANIRINEMKPRSGIFITRLNLINKKFKLNIGAHLPAFQVDDDFHMTTFFAKEVSSSYQLNERIGFHLIYINGKGMNEDFGLNMMGLTTVYTKNKFRFSTQLYLMDFENTNGFAESISYRLSERFSINGFINKTLSTGQVISTIGLQYHM